MNRQQIREKFRAENPEVIERVASDALLNTWVFDADKEVAAVTRCIISNESEIIDSVAETQFYDLSQITKFYDIDDLPGGGVYHDDVPIKKASPAEMNQVRRKWKTDSSSDTPKRWWRRGKYLWFDRLLATADVEIAIDCVYISDDFTGEADLPFNNQEHLIPFHDSINKYLQWRIMKKLKKKDDAATALKDYQSYTKWMKSMVAGYSNAAIHMRPSSAYRGTTCG